MKKLLKQWVVMGTSLCALSIVSYGQTTGQAVINVSAGQPGAVVSSNLFGIFFEEINSAGDGGLYGELDLNRSFEDSTNSIPGWTLVTSGSATGEMGLDTSMPLSATNVQALKLTKLGGTGSVGAVNGGYWGIPLTAGATYNLTFYARVPSGFNGFLTAALQSSDGTVYAQDSVVVSSANWQSYSFSLVPNQSDPAAELLMEIAQNGSVYLDFVSLFPAQTFNNRTNGLRPDLANMLANLKPSFVRFPGGSWIDGDSIADAYHWEPTVGNPVNRVPRYDLWGYMVDNGLGYHEYLQMCEDIGALPLFAVNCGMDVEQDAVPTNQLGSWVQEAVDAVAYATDPTNTTWGAQRAANGHPAPFNLQLMEIGNENNGAAYNANYGLFYTAVKSNYPFMHLIANSQGTIPTSAPVEIVDEHYYSDQATFISYATKYDSYSRAGPRVFVGEYAVTSGSGTGNLAGALGEAAFMTGMERNSDIVVMASYAPLFANLSNVDWNPDLIYFNGTQVYGTPSYYVQQMFSLNRGNIVLPTGLTVQTNPAASLVQGGIGVGSWNTSVQYTNIVVTSNGVTLYQSDFVDDGTDGWDVYNGDWSASNGLYQQTAITTDCYSTTGNTNWANYTISLQARKVGGDEGFLVLFNVLDHNDWTWWNIGGWSDTLDGIEQTINGNKTTYAQVPQFIAENTWYYIRIVVTGARAQCYLGTNASQAATNLVQDVTVPPVATGGFAASSTYANAAGQIIVKAVNANDAPMATTFNITGVNSIASNATVIQLTSSSSADENSISAPTYVYPVTNSISNASTNFTLTLPANSLSILRLNTGGLNSYTNLLLQFPSPIDTGQLVASTVLGQVSGNWVNLTANTNYAIAWSSANTNVAVVDINGNVAGVGPGTTTIIATYASLGLVATQAVQVSFVPVTLLHRYSFVTGTANDLVGNANGTLAGNATITGGRLVLPNTTSAAPATDYLELPSGILLNPLNGSGTNNDSTVSVEAWATIKPGQYTWANLFDFGNRDANGQAEYDIHVCVHSSDDSTIAGISDSDSANVDYQYIDLGSGTSLDGATNMHIAAIFDPPGGYVAIYLNGVLAGANNSVTIPMSGVQAIRNVIGADDWPDPGMQGSIAEFRIYNGALSAAQIAATDALGPSQLLSTASPALGAAFAGANLTLTWPLANAGYVVQTSTNLAANSWTSVAVAPQIVGGQWQAIVPLSLNAQFFRLTQ